MQNLIWENSNFRPNTSKPTKLRNKNITKSTKNRPYTSISRIPRVKKLLLSDDNDEKVNKIVPQINVREPNIKILNIETNKNYRFSRPSSNYNDRIFNKYWESNKDDVLSVKNVGIKYACNLADDSEKIKLITNPLILEHHNQAIGSDLFKRNLYKFPKIDWGSKKSEKVLTTINGSEIDNQLFNSDITLISSSTRPNSGSIINLEEFPLKMVKDNLKRPLTTNFNNKKKLLQRKDSLSKDSNKITGRPMTAQVLKNNNSKLRPISSIKRFEYINSDKDKDNIMDIEELVEESLSLSNNSYSTAKIQIKHFPNVESLVRNYENLDVKNYSVKMQLADTDLLDIFDRSQRTSAATLSKEADYEYYSPIQRIGSFMEFSQHLKFIDLKKIEKQLKLINSNSRKLNSTKNTQSKRITINSGNFNDPNSLFHGFMKNESVMEKYFIDLGNKGGTYDPIQFLPKFEVCRLHDQKNWPQEFQKRISISISNYTKYLTSDKILKSDLISFDRELFHKFMRNIDIKYFSVKNRLELINEQFIEIEDIFYYTLKRLILEYILRSPFERIRLNIQLLPKKTLPSSFVIAENGSFNRSLYTSWVENYSKSYLNMHKVLYNINIISSALCNWIQHFKNLNLLYMLGEVNSDYKTVHINEFYNYQYAYMKKMNNFLSDIFYRGVLLILRKNKYLKKNSQTDGKWTFKGFVPVVRNDSKDMFPNDDYYGMEFSDLLQDFWADMRIDDLLDIRMTPSFYAYATLLKKENNLNLSVSEYDSLKIEDKIKINTSVTTNVTIFLRGLVEKSIQQISNFIFSHKFINEIYLPSVIHSTSDSNDKINFTYDINANIYYLENDIKLPDLKSFRIKDKLKPIIDIKSKYDTFYKVIKLEYTHEQISEFFFKLIDTCLTQFNNFPSTHFLEFKKILPSEYEKIQKEHSIHLNDIFLQLNSIKKNEVKIFPDDYYRNMCPNIIIDEVIIKDNLKTYLKVANTTEEMFVDLKIKITKFIKTHLIEMEEFVIIFDPLKELISNQLGENVNEFVEIVSTSSSTSVLSFTPFTTPILDYKKYTYYVDRIRTFQKYISTIPNYIRYSLFSIDTRETKSELVKKINEIMINLMKSLEDLIIILFNNGIEKYSKIHKLIDKRLNSPEELLEMEKIKHHMANDLYSIQRDFEDADKIFNYLLNIDHIFSDNLINKTEETIKRHLRFKKELDDIEKLHQADKNSLENKFRDGKKKLDEDIQQFYYQVNLFDSEVRIDDYEIVINKINILESSIYSLKHRIDLNLKDEELLFSFKIGDFEMYDKAVKKLAKLSLMWKKSSIFYEFRRNILQNFSEEIDLIKSIKILEELASVLISNKLSVRKDEEIVIKMSEIVEEDLKNFLEFLEILNQIIELTSQIDDQLKNKIITLLDSKKLDSACKNILRIYYHKKLNHN